MSVFDRLTKNAFHASGVPAISAISATDGQNQRDESTEIAEIAEIAGGAGFENQPPPLTDQDREDLAEARAERSAIAEFDGGLSREDADHEATKIRAWSVLVQMPSGHDRPARWITMICTGDQAKARRHAEGTFTARRVIAIHEGTA